MIVYGTFFTDLFHSFAGSNGEHGCAAAARELVPETGGPASPGHSAQPEHDDRIDGADSDAT